MRIVSPTCGFCGNPFSPPADVNALKTFCKSCSGQRKTLASEAFSDRAVRIAHEGKYVLSDGNAKSGDHVYKCWPIPIPLG